MQAFLARSGVLHNGCSATSYQKLCTTHVARRFHGHQSRYYTTTRALCRARNFPSRPAARKDDAQQTTASLANTVRQAMRHVPHPVAVITASPKGDNGPSTDPHHWRGATVSSFVTVALDPEPVVCFNIKRDSSTFAALTSSTRFNIHVLSASDTSETIATKFAGGNALEPFHDGEGDLELWVDEAAAVDGDHPIIGCTIKDQPGETVDVSEMVLFRLSCTYMPDKTVDIGDHVVVFGKVVGSSEHQRYEPTLPCLLYVHGKYTKATAKR